MGEVYRARDTRLDREVAIKVLPTEFATDEERLRRFEREAKSLASLNHPNIAQIHGVDQVGTIYFLVLELVEGETLEDRLKRGALPIDEALEFCKQIAEGLEAAHEASVIHRDLKPANIRITPDGKLKLLDFGLAKSATVGQQHSSDSVLSTEQGRLLGTPTYMAPEQARGRPIDKRVDIWAYGCVMYECLTAQRAFEGETLTDVLASVLDKEPDWTRLPPATPARVRELLRACFEKNARARLRDVGDARRILEAPGAAGEEPALRTTAARGWLPWMLCTLLVLALGFVLLRGPKTLTQVAAPIYTAVRLPEGVQMQLNTNVDETAILALSPDGSKLAFVARHRRECRLGGRLQAQVRPRRGHQNSSTLFPSRYPRAAGSAFRLRASPRLRFFPVCHDTRSRYIAHLSP